MLIRDHKGRLIAIDKNQYSNDKQYYIVLMKLKNPNNTEEIKDIIGEILIQIQLPF